MFGVGCDFEGRDDMQDCTASIEQLRTEIK